MFQRVCMKSFFISFCLLFLAGVFLLPAAYAGNDRRATILFTGSVRGNLDPIHT